MPHIRQRRARRRCRPKFALISAVILLFFLVLAGFGVFVGVGVMRRRNWARITMLIWGGMMAFFRLGSAVAFSLVIFTAGAGLGLPNANGVDGGQAHAVCENIYGNLLRHTCMRRHLVACVVYTQESHNGIH